MTLYVTTRGLTTGPIPYGGTTFDFSFDLLENKLAVTTSEGGAFSFPLDDPPVAEFYRRLFEGLAPLEIDASINTRPFDLDDEHALDIVTNHRTYDGEHVRRYHRVLTEVDQIFREFAGRLNSKTSPVQLFWHSFDLAVTRFSGKRVHLPEGTDPVTREAYSHEVISFGFWPGDREVREPTFYSYTAPEPQDLTEQPLRLQTAYWAPEGGTALLAYEEVPNSRNTPEKPCWSSSRAPTRRGRGPRAGIWRLSEPTPAKKAPPHRATGLRRPTP